MVCAERLHGHVGVLTKYGRAMWKHGVMLPKDFVPLNASLRYRRDWFAGLMDADGTVITDNGDGLQLASIDLDFLKKVRLMLTTMGVQAKLNLMKPAVMKHDHPKFAGYESKDCWRLLINQADTYRLLNDVGVTCRRSKVTPTSLSRRCTTVRHRHDRGRSWT